MEPLTNETDMGSNQPPGEGKLPGWEGDLVRTVDKAPDLETVSYRWNPVLRSHKLGNPVVPQEFIKLYYKLLNMGPEFLHQLYLDDSSALVSEAQDEGPPHRVQANNIEDIKKLMMMFSDIHVVVTNYTPQDSLDDSLILLTTGKLSKKNAANEELPDTERLFTQAFVLAKQKSGFYVKTDTLQIHSSGCPYKFLSKASLQEPTQAAATATTPPFQLDHLDAHREIQFTSPPAEPIEVDEAAQTAQPMVEDEPVDQEKPIAPPEPMPVNNPINSRSPAGKAGVNTVDQGLRKPEKLDAWVQPPVETVAPISGPPPKLSYAQVLREKKVAAAAAAASQASRSEDFKVVAQLPKQTGEAGPPRQAPIQDSGWGQSPPENQSYSGNAVVGSASNLKLFVSHLPLHVTPTKVAEIFSIFGEIVDPGSVKVNNRNPNCTAIVTFQTEAGFRKALDAQIDIGNEKIVVQPWENRSRTLQQNDNRGGRGRHGRRRGGWGRS